MNCLLPSLVRGLSSGVVIAMLAGCAVTPFAQSTVTTHGPGTAGGAEPPGARSYACDDGSRIHLLTRREVATLAIGGRTLELARRPAEAGVRYAGEGVELRRRGERVRVTAPDQRRECRDAGPAGPWADAALRGVEIRAIGHEPGWSLEIVPGGWLHFSPAGDGDDVLALDPVRAVGTDGTRRYTARADGRELQVRLREAACTDTVSGERFALHVAVSVDGRTLEGCGRRL